MNVKENLINFQVDEAFAVPLKAKNIGTGRGRTRRRDGSAATSVSKTDAWKHCCMEISTAAKASNIHDEIPQANG